MNNSLNIDKLVQITVKYLKKQNLKSLDDVQVSRKLNSKNIYDLICLDYFQNTDYKNKYRISQLWKRNSNSFADKVKADFNKQSNENIILIEFSYDEWIIELEKNQEFYGKRSKFNADFTVTFSIKLQQKGIKCWLKCCYNWFKQNQSLHKNAAFWRGQYVCIKEPTCKNKFVAEITSDSEKYQKIIIKVMHEIKSDNDHTDFLKYTPRCSGELRDKTVKEIMSIGVMNVQTNNVIHNSFSKSNLTKLN